MIVRVSKRVVCGKHYASCYKEIDFPIAPFIGMAVGVDDVGDESDPHLTDPYEITGVYYDPKHDILWASIGYSIYDKNEFSPDQEEDEAGALSQFQYETVGWTIEIKEHTVWVVGPEITPQSLGNQLTTIENHLKCLKEQREPS